MEYDRSGIQKVYTLTDVEYQRAVDWYNNLRPRILEKQKEILTKAAGDNPDRLEQYQDSTRNWTKIWYGACGGGVVVTFSPNAIACAVKFREHYTGEEINVTDYDCW